MLDSKLAALLEEGLVSSNLAYEGKGKKLYRLSENLLEALLSPGVNICADEVLLCVFKDDLTAFNAQKRSSQEGKGGLNCRISTEIFRLIEAAGLSTHYLPLRDGLVVELPHFMLCRKLEIILIEVVVRNVAAGSLVKRLGIKEKTWLKDTRLGGALVEFYYKNDELGDPIITDSHCLAMDLASLEELEVLRRKALKINSLLSDYFDKAGLLLVDFKLEFGRSDGKILLGDEISPDSCRLWDKSTGKKMDKDRFREDLGDLGDAYKEVLNRISRI